MDRGQAGGMTPRQGACAALALVALALLAACYLPNNFKAEVRLGRTGDFALAFYGELVWAPLYRDIEQGKLSSEEIPAKVEGIRQDLARDSNFKKIESLGQGRFKVAYEREGRLSASQEVTFVRRNAIILEIRARPDGRVSVDGNALRPADAKTITDIGLGMKGEFRVITDGLVKEQNATRVEPYNGYQLYIWTIDSPFSPSPHFVMQREGAWPSGPQGG